MDYAQKMKSFRILLIIRYLKSNNESWLGILRYWYAANIIAISNQRLINLYPHAQDTNNIPDF